LISPFSFDDADRADSVELVYLFDEALDVMRRHLRQQHVDLFARSVGREEKPLDLPGADAKRLLEQFGSQRAVCSLDLETATLIARMMKRGEWKAAAFAWWHEPDDARVSRPDL
jgi:hypothetical protein